MSNDIYPQLQLAVDVLSTEEMLKIADLVYPNFDILEIGTCLIIEDGLSAVEAAKARYPDKKCLADIKIMDAAQFEATSGFKRGSDIITVLAAADDKTILETLEIAAKYGKQVMVDLLNVPDPVLRAVELENMGVQLICLHTAYDLQEENIDPTAHLTAVRAAVNCTLAVAGGIKLDNVAGAIVAGADIAIVGGAITKNPQPKDTAVEFTRLIKEK
jgi:3-hexulose-6-phosphate synthase